MARRTSIIDDNQQALIEGGGYLRVSPAPFPPDDNRDIQKVYRSFLTLNGDGTTSSFLVDGSTTSQLFYIEAVPDLDIYVTSISFLLAATGITLGNDFLGNGAPLTNGIRIYYEDNNGETNIGTDLVVNFSFIRLCQGNPPFGDGATAFQATGISGAGKNVSDGYLPVLDFKSVFGFQYGLKLARNTTHRLVIEINDDLSTGLGAGAQFDAIAYGFERKEG